MHDDDSQFESADGSSDRSTSTVALRVTGLAAGGDAVGRLADGRVVFVEGGVPGDLVELADLTTRKNLARARIRRVIEPSPDRSQPRCAHFGACGGCRWQHVEYAAQLEAKRTMIRDALERIGGLVLADEFEIIASPDPYAYRARARLVESNGRLGYRKRGSHGVEVIDECPILAPAAHAAMLDLSRSIANETRGGGARPSVSSGRSRAKDREWIVTAGSSGPAIVRPARRSPRRSPTKKSDPPAARESVDLDVLGEGLRASSESFVQGNSLLWNALAEEVRAQCTLDFTEGVPARFLELHAGIGFLTLPLARYGLSGIAIESDRSALSDLAANLATSGLAKQVEVIRGRVEARGDLTTHLRKADLLLTDPPRVGLDAKVRRAIVSDGPRRIVYVSCDPATLARDVRVFSEAGYVLAHLCALDLFPQTPHVEVVVRLERPGR